MKKKLLLFVSCAAVSFAALFIFSRFSFYSSSNIRFLLMFFLCWEAICIFLIPAKFSFLKTSGKWGSGIALVFSILMAACVLLFPIYLDFLPFWALGAALLVLLLLALVSLSIVYGSLKFLEQQDSQDD